MIGSAHALEADGGASELLFVSQTDGTLRATVLDLDRGTARFPMTRDHALALRDFLDRWLGATGDHPP